MQLLHKDFDILGVQVLHTCTYCLVVPIEETHYYKYHTYVSDILTTHHMTATTETIGLRT